LFELFDGKIGSVADASQPFNPRAMLAPHLIGATMKLDNSSRCIAIS